MHHIFFIHTSIDGHLGCLHVLAVVDKAAVNMGVRTSLPASVSIFFGKYPEEELLDPTVVLCLLFKGMCILVYPLVLCKGGKFFSTLLGSSAGSLN